MILKIKKLKITAVILCALVAAGSFTYVTDHNHVTVEAKTVSDLEDEKAANEAEIAKLQGEMDDIDGDISQAEKEQQLLQEKIDLQNENIDIVNTKINDLSNRISEKEKKIEELKVDIANKQDDINVGLEQFKERLRAMYISGNDSLASALVGATDFYDMLSKIELISQVAKHDDELIDNLKTQLQQFEEAQAQLDAENQELSSDLDEQESYKQELNAAIIELNNDYQESQDYIDRQEAEKAAKAKNC